MTSCALTHTSRSEWTLRWEPEDGLSAHVDIHIHVYVKGEGGQGSFLPCGIGGNGAWCEFFGREEVDFDCILSAS